MHGKHDVEQLSDYVLNNYLMTFKGPKTIKHILSTYHIPQV